MRKLDEKKSYYVLDLSDVQKDELLQVIEMKPSNRINLDIYMYIYFKNGRWLSCNTNDNIIVSSKELFYTLENIQVDCRELSNIQIKIMADVFENNRFKLQGSLAVSKQYYNIGVSEFGYAITLKEENKTTITYDKFMELFGNEEKENEHIERRDKKPKQYQIGIDTFERCEANMTKEEILACVRFNIDKYTWRNKGQDLEDLEKIISYANWGIKQLKK